MDNVMVRDMTENDLAEVMGIERSSFVTPWTEKLFREEFSLPFCHDLVAEKDGTILGYISFAVVVDEIHLRNLAVREDQRRQGVASSLLSAMAARGRGQGALRATLEVRKSNGAAINLYTKRGFVIQGIRPFYYTDTREDALILWGDLADKGA